MQTGTAYDFDTFTPRQPHQRLRLAQGAVEPVKKKKGLSRTGRQTLKIGSLAVLFFALICSVLYSQTMVTELNAQITRQEKELSQAQSEYSYLSTQMEMKTNLKSVEEYATSRLGLVKLDPSQIVYIDRERQSAIACEEGWWSKLLESAQKNSMSFFMEYRRQ